MWDCKFHEFSSGKIRFLIGFQLLNLWALAVSFPNGGNSHQLCKLKLTPTRRLFAHVKVLLDYLLVPFFSVDTRTFCYLAYYQRLIMALFYLYPAIISWNNLEHRLPSFYTPLEWSFALCIPFNFPQKYNGIRIHIAESTENNDKNFVCI